MARRTRESHLTAKPRRRLLSRALRRLGVHMRRQRAPRTGFEHGIAARCAPAWRPSVAAWVVASTLCVAGPARADLSAEERAALTGLYQATNGAGWTDSTGWNGAPGTECAWNGVECDEAGDHVFTLALASNNLVGPLPSLAGMSQLRNLYLSDNVLSGTLPALAAFPLLEVFEVTSNQFTGSIPTLSGSTALKRYGVAGNLLTGALPSLAGLPNIESFDASANQLTGSIPALGNLPSLREFVAVGNQLTGTLPTLAGTPGLTVFDVGGNLLDGTIPPIGTLTELIAFGVGYNLLTGPLPDLSPLTKLRFLDVSANRLEGPLPALSALGELEYADFGDNQFTGTLPSLAGLSALAYFGAIENQLDGPIPPFSGNGALAFYSVSNNRLSGTVPSLAGLTALRSLYLYGNALDGALPGVPNPNALEPEASRVCPNDFAQVDDAAWNAATGVAPWFQDCIRDPGLSVDGTLETSDLQRLVAEAGNVRYDWSVDGDAVVGRTSASPVLEVSYPSEFDDTISVVATDADGASTTTTVPLRTEAPRIVAQALGPAVEECGNGDSVPQAGKRFGIPIQIRNDGAVALRSGFALFVPQDRYTAAAAGLGTAGVLQVNTPIVPIPNLAPGQAIRSKVSVTISPQADCGANLGLLFKGGVDALAFSADESAPIATLSIPAAPQCQAFVGTCAGTPAPLAKAQATPRQGLYFNPNRPGNGLGSFVIPAGNNPAVYFGAWFTADADRTPTWYIIQGPLNGSVAIAPIYRFTRDVQAPTFSVSSTIVGQAVVTQKDAESLILLWRIGDRLGLELMQYFVGGPSPTPNRNGAWYAPIESGWGQVVHQYLVNGQSNTFVVDYLYDAAGAPRWVLAQGTTPQLESPTAHLTFRAHCPGCAWIPDWNANALAAGPGTLRFVDGSNAIANAAFVLPGPLSGTWTRNDLALKILTVPQ